MKGSSSAVLLALIAVALMLFVPPLVNTIFTYATVTVDTTPPHISSPPTVWLSYEDGTNKQSFTLSESQSDPTAVDDAYYRLWAVSYTHLTLPTNREV